MPLAPFIFDFAGTRRVFANAVEVIRADTLSEVIPALQRVEAASAAGKWAAGYVSYEAAPAFEPAMSVRSGRVMPLVFFGVFESVLSGDDAVPGFAPDAGPDFAPDARPLIEWTPETTSESFHIAIAQIHEAIAAGETYQVNYTNRLHGVVARPAARALYERLRAAQGGGFHAYLDIGGHTIVSASPELFFEKRDGTLYTRPMKGTRPRGRWSEEDSVHATELADSAKDRAENLMIVDLLRNDVGRLCEMGSVRVPALFDIERYSTVWQMTSRIEGTLRAGVGLPEIFGSLFPCGSVTGAPKINTMKWIANLEASSRDVYCGAIGFVEPGGDCVFNVPIRTVWIDNATSAATYGVGSGITADSNAAAELEELHAKSSILHATSRDYALLETMRCEDGVILRGSSHVDRVIESARYFGFPVARVVVEDALQAAASAAASGAASGAASNAPTSVRLRMLVASTGVVSVEKSGDVPVRFTDREACRASRGMQHVVLAPRPVNSLDPFLCHKTTNRTAYDAARIDGPYFDTLLWNEKNEVTEFTIGNVVLSLDGELITPPRTSGLLAGVFRGELLRAGLISERLVDVADLRRCSRIWLINSLREWVEVELQERPPESP